jgi:serine/threonine protein phosphatase PrpC
MSRSIGDLSAQSAGVISTPEIVCHDIQKEDLFLVVASDGIWEWLTNDRVVSLVTQFYNDGNGVQQICNKLVLLHI